MTEYRLFSFVQKINFISFTKKTFRTHFQVLFLNNGSGELKPHCTVGVQMELKHEEATFSYIASLLRFNGMLLRYYGAETYSVINCLIINKDFCPGRL